jgi:hypothetical protein
MDRDRFMRRVLWISAILNLGGAFLFAFPSSPPGQAAGLPTAVPPMYRAMLAFFVLLFGGAYAWLARRPKIDRSLVALSAIGKAGAFGIVFALWLLGQSPGLGVIAVTADLILAGAFAWWLVSGPSRMRASE